MHQELCEMLLVEPKSRCGPWLDEFAFYRWSHPSALGWEPDWRQHSCLLLWIREVMEEFPQSLKGEDHCEKLIEVFLQRWLWFAGLLEKSPGKSSGKLYWGKHCAWCIQKPVTAPFGLVFSYSEAIKQKHQLFQRPLHDQLWQKIVKKM